jgi:trigger factor
VKVSTEKLGNSQVVLNIEVEPAEMEKSLQEAYHRLAGKIHVPGFRKGKAPRPILESYIGEETLRGEALESLVPQLCNQAIEEQEIEPLIQPEVEIVQTEPVVFKATVFLRPSIELGDYHGIRLSPEPAEITEEQIDSVIEQLRDQHALWEPVERPVQFEDLVIIDIEEMVEGELVKSYPGQQVRVIEGSHLPLPDFVEQLVGMEQGQEKEVILSYPDDYEIMELAGIQHHFKVNLIEIKEKYPPELNDEFAKSIGENLETIDALRDRVTDNLKKMAEEKAAREFEEKAIQATVELAKAEFPPVMIEQEIDHILSERRESFGGGQRGVENYLRNIGKTEEEAREELRPLATQRVTRALVLGKIVEEEKIAVGAAEIDSEIEQMIEHSTKDVEELQNVFGTPAGRRWIEQKLLSRKTVQHLVDIVSGSAITEEKGGNDVDST